VKLCRTPAELEETLDYSDFVELIALDSLDQKPASPFGSGPEAELFEHLS
jgi:hypothetical protein